VKELPGLLFLQPRGKNIQTGHRENDVREKNNKKSAKVFARTHSPTSLHLVEGLCFFFKKQIKK